MNTGLLIEFFEPSNLDKVYEGKLFLDVEGKNYFSCGSDFRHNHFGPVKALYAISNGGEKYSFINCAFNFTDFATYRFTINEIYKGDHIQKVTIPCFSSAEARMTFLSRWINHPRFKQSFSSSAHEPGNIELKQQFSASFPIAEGLSVELNEFCTETFNRSEIILRSIGYIKVVSTVPCSRLKLIRAVTAFQRLLFLFTDTVPRLTALEYRTLDERTIEQIFPERIKKLANDGDPLLDYPKLSQVWGSVMSTFYADRQKFVKVLDLLIESLENRTAEVSFLNVTTAFEVFHKSFYENDRVALDLYANALLTLGIASKKPEDWIQILRYYHVLDLVKDFTLFKNEFPDMDKLLLLMRNSRNYYTHYSKPKGRIWTPNRLLYVNKTLRQLLKGAILIQLGIPTSLINQLLNNRASIFYHDYETNEYSINCLSADED